MPALRCATAKRYQVAPQMEEGGKSVDAKRRWWQAPQLVSQQASKVTRIVTAPTDAQRKALLGALNGQQPWREIENGVVVDFDHAPGFEN